MIKAVLSALLVSGNIYAGISSLNIDRLNGLASENAASLMKLTDKECMRWPGGTCYGLVVDDDDSNPIDVETAEDWVNRVEIVE